MQPTSPSIRLLIYFFHKLTESNWTEIGWFEPILI